MQGLCIKQRLNLIFKFVNSLVVSFYFKIRLFLNLINILIKLEIVQKFLIYINQNNLHEIFNLY